MININNNNNSLLIEPALPPEAGGADCTGCKTSDSYLIAGIRPFPPEPKFNSQRPNVPRPLSRPIYPNLVPDSHNDKGTTESTSKPVPTNYQVFLSRATLKKGLTTVDSINIYRGGIRACRCPRKVKHVR